MEAALLAKNWCSSARHKQVLQALIQQPDAIGLLYLR